MIFKNSITLHYYNQVEKFFLIIQVNSFYNLFNYKNLA